IQYLKCDLADWQDIKALSALGIKGLRVIYLAANLDPCEDGEHVPSVLSDNILALGSFLSAFAGRIDHLVYLSSVSVYGRPEYNPIDENHPTHPYSIYGTSKVSAEMIARNLCARHNTGLTIIRATQLFGLSSADSSLPHLLLTRMRNGQPLKITCDPAVERDYLHVRDLIDLLVRAIEHPAAGIFNAGSGSPIRIGDLFELMFKKFGIPFDLNLLLQKPLQPSFTQVLSIGKARERFGFDPSYPIQKWIADLAEGATN
ncbi:MAG: NAD(P)-dependent oxidoreductase, partial [Acidobacteriota bacterium]|nr:NAD(P)-dependent oxidoreductase [Acidobacteriota bacterium]